MFEVIFTIFALIGAATYAAIFLIVALCTFFDCLGSKQLFGDDNEK